MVRRLHLLLVAMAACVPGPLDETGKQCSPLRPCGEDFICVNSTCQDVAFDAGPPLDAGVDAGRDAGVDAGFDAGTDAGIDAGRADAGSDAGQVDAGPADAGSDAGFPFNTNLLANPGFEVVTADGGERFWRANPGVLSAGTPARSGQWAGRLMANSTSNPSLVSDQVPGETLVSSFFCAEAWVRHDLDAGPTVTMSIRERYGDGGLDSSNGASTPLVRGAWRRIEERWQSYGNATLEVRFTTTRIDLDASVLIDDVVLMRMPTATCVFP